MSRLYKEDFAHIYIKKLISLFITPHFALMGMFVLPFILQQVQCSLLHKYLYV